jgi:hypothetical protein
MPLASPLANSERNRLTRAELLSRVRFAFLSHQQQPGKPGENERVANAENGRGER